MDLSPRILQRAAEAGIKRTRNFRATRLMFLRAFVGQYYDRDAGDLGAEPLNYSFGAVKILVPSIAARAPKVEVHTEYLVYRQYAEILALALNQVSKKLNLPEIIQRGLIDAFFTMGIFRTGLAASADLIQFGEEAVDPGQLFVETVDFDNFTFDPDATSFNLAAFLGEKIAVERSMLLDSGRFDNSVIERLPAAGYTLLSEKKTRDLSRSQLMTTDISELHDWVELYQLWIPSSNSVVIVPVEGDASEFLHGETYYGPSNGGYTFLSLTPPVPNNPLPIALAGIWHDMHTEANRVVKKMIDQAAAQKDILGYNPSVADDAQEIIDAQNLDAVKMENPDLVKTFSFGGQNPLNERMVSQLALWFNEMSGNTNLLGGLGDFSNTATKTVTLRQGAATAITYMQERVYGAAKEILRNCAWYLHTDPLIQMPMIKREMVPAEYQIFNDQIVMVRASSTKETQIFLTPEVRDGDFLDFAFDIVPESMAPEDPQSKLQQLELLTVRIIPAAAQAAALSAQAGQPFSFRVFVTRAAKLLGIDWIEEIFMDQELAAIMLQRALSGPRPQKGMATGKATVGQNQGASVGQMPPPESVQMRQGAQEGANQAQATLPIREV